ncbi:MAG: ExeM/NucH family extracellular endonuclease [Oscillochloridaceae bacterium umkhey_bin13]
MVQSSPRGRAAARLATVSLLVFALLASLIGFVPTPAFATTDTLTQWNFNSPTPDNNPATGTTNPSTGSGTASLLGGTTATFASGAANGGSTDPAGTTDNSGWNVTTFAAQGTGDRSRGVQFAVDTTGRQDLVIRWDQRYSNTAPRHAQLQYSTDGTNFIDFGSPFEGTAGDTWFNNRSVNLSSIPGVNNNPNFAFRIVAAFAPGTNAYTAANTGSNYATTGTWRFDMVTITSAPFSGAAVAPSIVTQPQSQNIATGGSATLTVVASGSEPLSYQWYQGTAPDTSTPVGTNNPSFTTPALNVITSYWVRVSNLAGSVDSQTAILTLTGLNPLCEQSFTPIYTIQGSGNNAVITGPVTTQGVVVGNFQGVSPALGGFYLQDLNGDGDLTTSDGIFVFNRGNPVTVQLGQIVRVSGSASEFQEQTQISSPLTITDCGVVATVAPVDVIMPFPAPVGGVPYLERYEGMLVRFPQQLFVTEHFQLGRFGQVVMSSGDRLYIPTNIFEPGPQAAALQAANDLNRIIVDDELNDQNPDPIRFGRGGNPLSASNTLRGGDSAISMVGVMSFGWAGNAASGNAYRLRPVGALGGGVPSFQPTNPRPTARPAVGGSLKVSAFNVLNYFLTLDVPNTTPPNPLDNRCGSRQNLECRGADSAFEFERQRTKLIQALIQLDADILGLIELENTPEVFPEADIVNALNTALGAPIYGFIDTGIIGTDAIKLGFIYKRTTVQPVGNFAVLNSQAFVNPRNAVLDRNRPALAQTFRELATGGIITVVNNHLKSKGSGCGTGDDDLTNGQGNCNGTRTDAALVLMDWIASDPTNSGDPDFMIVGDLNSYAKEDPIAVIEEFGFVNLGPLFGGDTTYSYVFDGQWGNLDHALASPSLLDQVTGAAKYHINADEPNVLDYNVEFKSASQVNSLFAPDEFRTSDHDPVLVGLNLTPTNSPPAVSLIVTYNTGLGENGAEIISLRGDRAVLSNAGDGSIDLLDASALPDLTLIQRIKLPELNGLTSVAVHPSKDLFVAVAGASNPRFGRALIFRLSDGALLTQYTIATDAASPNGRQPDSVEISPDGRFAVIAIEAEQVNASDDGGNGAIVVLDLRGFDPANPDPLGITGVTVEFPSIAGVPGVGSGRTFDVPGNPVVNNAPGTIEPEGIAFAPDSSVVYLALQENNAIARLSLTDPLPSMLPVGNIFGLGQVDFLTDRINDNSYNPVNRLNVPREPDGIRVVEIGGTRYLLTADEGDTRPNPRGGRTMSIFNAATGALVADLGNQLADLAFQYGLYPDNRSPNGGVEPEMLDVITVNGRVIVAIGLERASSIAFADVTTPTAPFVFGLVRSGSNPEGIKLVARDGQLFALSANEVSGTVTVATVPIDNPRVTLGYLANTPRNFGVGAIDADRNATLNISLSLSPANAGMLSQTNLAGNLAQLNPTLASLNFTPAPGFMGPATVTVRVSDGVNPPAIGTIDFADRTPDLTPPTTTARVSGVSNPLCPSDCFANQATVTLSAEDDRSGVATTSYRVNGGTFQNYSTPFVITNEGANLVEFFSTDNVGNVEAVQRLAVNVSRFPATGVLDDFNRAIGNGRLGNNWSGATQHDRYRLTGSNVLVDKGGLATWRRASYGPNQEAFMRLTSLNATSQHHTLALKVRGNGGRNGAILVSYDAANQRVTVEALVVGQGYRLVASYPATAQAGALLGAQALADGSVKVYLDCLLLGTADTRSMAGESYVNQGGEIGVWFMDAAGARFDDFGGGNLP